ncbi:MAG: MFS transporter [Acetobacteraceae bacterium]|nr:MFS transporter [Acetobacteraceae bacterium]
MLPPAYRQVALALLATFSQQTCLSIGRALPAVLAPVIVVDLHLSPAWIGVYFAINATAALVGQLGCGSFIVRYGSLRMSQVALAMLAIGMILATFTSPLLFALSAIIGGGGAAVSTPASSHLLGRVSPPRHAPLVFSIKQTSVPAGLLVGGILGPWLAGITGWRSTFILVAIACIALAALLEPLRKGFDDDRVPSHAFRISDFKTTLTSVLRIPELRALSIACLAFNGMQQVVTAYFVTYLVHLGYGLAAAGFVFSAAVSIAVPGRILWGWIGSGWSNPRMVMAGLAFGMAVSGVAMGFFTAAWPVLLIGAVSAGISLTALSWHGVLLAEAARAAPEGKRGAVTGGVLSFGQLGALTEPILYSILLSLTGSYGFGFIVCAAPALLVGVLLRRPQRSG